jgi:alpha-tubulin suppressor-like RCC1 family protein
LSTRATRRALTGIVLVAAALASGCGARSSLSVPAAKRVAADPCAGIACETPPAPTCVSATTLRTSTTPGTCADGECSYASIDTECPEGCNGGKCGVAVSRVMVSAGDFNTCAVTPAGAVKCWGSNSNGKLGSPSVIGSTSVPVEVEGLSSGMIAVSTGDRHTCAITSAGGVKCWGASDSGQLGDGLKGTGEVPVDVVGLASGVRAVSPGTFGTCAVTTADTVKCWGGTGFAMFDPTGVPYDVPDYSSSVVDISEGENHVCAVTSAGAVKCSGSNVFGELGNDSTVDSMAPVDVVGLPPSIVVSAGFSETCALTSGGAVKCWGYNLHGQLGDGTTTNSLVPVDVVGLSAGAIDVSIGLNHACAVTAAGGVKCWGWNFYGQLGNGSTADSFVPVDVVGLSEGIVAVSAGSAHTCAITATGAVKCWGSNTFGELGAGADASSSVPVDVVGL